MPTNLATTARRCIAPVLASALLIVSACGGGGGSDAGTNNSSGGGGGIVDPGTITPVVTTSVSLVDLSFSPASIQVSPGATLTFTNNDVGTAHNVTFAAGGAASIGDFTSGSRSTVAPSTPGTYSYQCTIHSGMRGVVKVQ